MNMQDIYRINITSELVMVAVLVFLLISCLLQRNRFPTAKPLILLISIDMLLLLCQVAEWLLMIASGNQIGSVLPAFREWKVLTYTLDYGLGYFSSLAFYHYVCEHIRELYAQNHQSYPDQNERWIKYLTLWGLAATVLFGAFMHQHWFYFLLPDGREMFHWGAYGIIYLMAGVINVFLVLKLFRHRKVLGKVNFTLLLLYKLMPTGLLAFDLLRSTCSTYLMRAFFAFILYVHVDLRGEKLLAEQKARIAKQEKDLTELNTQIMLSQMQPHFLYNTLTTISSLCYIEGAVRSKEVVDRFSDYFRENLDTLGKQRYIPFEKELQHIQTYLWLEQVRFGDALKVEYDIQTADFLLPSLSVQPLVENAVKHGIRRKKGGGTVKISTKELENAYEITVSDTGAGFIVGTVPEDGRSHVGIENIRSRLQILCGGTCEIQSVPNEGTLVTVHIPKGEKL